MLLDLFNYYVINQPLLFCLASYFIAYFIFSCFRFYRYWFCFFTLQSYYNSSSVCLCVCLWVCSLSPPRSFDGSLPNLVGVCRLTSHLPLRGSFSKRSTGRRVNGSLSLSTILYMRQPHATCCNGAFCFCC